MGYYLYVTADLENLTNFQPNGGVDDPNFTYYFKLKCGNCGTVTEKATCVSLNETGPQSKKCKVCEREGTVTMFPGKGKPLTAEISEKGRY
ncbi:uncharacterized protein [Rutidosis leptorrhynchoides]|uniref:uncharacterized protein n=1 Tax=Rutidosis leptorrhynchoides TaxID=125765 RepID=UPI003A98E832